MITCDNCNDKVNGVFLDENDEGDFIFSCEKCYNGKIKHRVYNEEAGKKLHKNVKQEITKCSNCRKEKIIEVSFKTIFSDEKYCNYCWNLRRIDFEFN